MAAWTTAARFPVREGEEGIFLLFTQPPIQSVPGALPLGVKRPGREADH